MLFTATPVTLERYAAAGAGRWHPEAWGGIEGVVLGTLWNRIFY